LTSTHAAQLLDVDDLPTEAVAVPEWKTTVIMRGLNAGDQLAYTDSIVDYAADGTVAKVHADGVFRLIAMSMVDEAGALVFEDVETGAAILRKKSSKAITRLATVAARLSAIDGAEAEALKNASGPATDDA